MIAESTGGDVIWYYYDSDGVRTAMEYEGDSYYYVYNLQGDVLGLVDEIGEVVVEYTYDSWGNILSVTGSMASTLGVDNPFRYRGYYYDEESGLYYLNSRYYDPVTGRFVNADGVMGINQDMTTYNLFAYCGNNPITRADDGGEFWNLVVGAIVGAASVYVGDVIENVANGKTGWDIFAPTSSVGTYLGAAASGMIPGSGIASVITRPIVSTGVKYGVDCGIMKQKVEVKDIAEDLVINYVGEALSMGANKVLNGARPQNYSSFRNQLTRRIPHITKQQTTLLMQSINRGATIALEAIGFVIDTVTNR